MVQLALNPKPYPPNPMTSPSTQKSLPPTLQTQTMYHTLYTLSLEPSRPNTDARLYTSTSVHLYIYSSVQLFKCTSVHVFMCTTVQPYASNAERSTMVQLALNPTPYPPNPAT